MYYPLPDTTLAIYELILRMQKNNTNESIGQKARLYRNNILLIVFFTISMVISIIISISYDPTEYMEGVIGGYYVSNIQDAVLFVLSIWVAGVSVVFMIVGGIKKSTRLIKFSILLLAVFVLVRFIIIPDLWIARVQIVAFYDCPTLYMQILCYGNVDRMLRSNIR
jgi:hypothetical protein